MKEKIFQFLFGGFKSITGSLSKEFQPCYCLHVYKSTKRREKSFVEYVIKYTRRNIVKLKLFHNLPIRHKGEAEVQLYPFSIMR
jgi:hypothetical protein